FLHDSATPSIYTLSLHDALPISSSRWWSLVAPTIGAVMTGFARSQASATWARGMPRALATSATRSTTFLSASCVLANSRVIASRSEEHTSELQSRGHLVCRLLLE